MFTMTMKTSLDEQRPSPGWRGWGSVLGADGVEGVEGPTPSVDVLLGCFSKNLFPSPVRNKDEIGMFTMFTASSSVRFPKQPQP